MVNIHSLRIQFYQQLALKTKYLKFDNYEEVSFRSNRNDGNGIGKQFICYQVSNIYEGLQH